MRNRLTWGCQLLLIAKLLVSRSDVTSISLGKMWVFELLNCLLVLMKPPTSDWRPFIPQNARCHWSPQHSCKWSHLSSTDCCCHCGSQMPHANHSLQAWSCKWCIYGLLQHFHKFMLTSHLCPLEAPDAFTTRFSKDNQSHNCFTYLIKTEPLFAAITDPGQESMLSAIFSGELFSLSYWMCYLILLITDSESDNESASGATTSAFANPSALCINLILSFI